MSGARLRDRILKKNTLGGARLILAADPDGLLLEATIHEALRERRFEVVTFEDPVAFRFDYESRFRSRQDRGEDGSPEIVVRIESSDLSTFPHDLLQTGRPISFGLSDLFPALNYPIVAALDRSDLDALAHRSGTSRPSSEPTRPRILRCGTFSISRPNSSRIRPTCCACCCADTIEGSVYRASLTTA